MRISDWSSDVCSSELTSGAADGAAGAAGGIPQCPARGILAGPRRHRPHHAQSVRMANPHGSSGVARPKVAVGGAQVEVHMAIARFKAVAPAAPFATMALSGGPAWAGERGPLRGRQAGVAGKVGSG